MWIWYVSKSDRGSVASIVAQAHAAGVTTLFIKSSDGSSNYWSQFSPQLVAELHANGLQVCAWQYVYGSEPRRRGRARRRGGRQRRRLPGDRRGGRVRRPLRRRADLHRRTARARSAPNYPLALASFPYVSYHPSFPYSVFLGPGGAQYNAPQMYWKDIGVSVDTVYANTYIANRIYGAPDLPARADLRRRLELRSAALPRGGRRLRRDRHRPSGTGRKPQPAAGRRSPRRSRR